MTILKIRAGKYLVPLLLEENNNNITVKFPYNKIVISEIKAMDGAKWNPESKCWSIANSFRNQFQLKFLSGENVYERYDRPLVEIKYSYRELYRHQVDMVRFGLTRRYCIIGADMGTGKTLAMIEIMEHLNHIGEDDYWYIGPNAGVRAVNLELEKWNVRFKPRMLTYNGLVTVMQNWGNQPAPKFVCFDESSKIKTPSSQRSKAALHLANAVRDEWGDDGCVLLMTGTPAPKNPCDWWQQSEVACPGYIREGNIVKFKARLCLMEQRESLSGGMYPHLITWLDDEKKCSICGQYEDHANHKVDTDSILTALKEYKIGFKTDKAPDVKVVADDKTHKYQPSKNEITFLYERLKGLVYRINKKDCLDLPDKIYKTIKVPPTPELLRTAKLIEKTSNRAITALTLLRELSDGFQYVNVATDEMIDCPACSGLGTVKLPTTPDQGQGTSVTLIDMPCDRCNGEGKIPRVIRESKVFKSPKEQIVIETLDELEDTGRCVIWGAFTGTIDKLKDLCVSQGWYVLQIDGRGFNSFHPDTCDPIDAQTLLKAMDASWKDAAGLKEKYPRVAVVANPEAGGMALTFTASPVEVFYSNSFNGEARMQSEDRIHRLGADKARGCTIIDIICLKSDEVVLENLKKKRRLQDMTLGELEDQLK